MKMECKSANLGKKNQTNLPDWSAMIPLVPVSGKRPFAVYRAIRGAIETGKLPAGAKLPPSRDLAKRFGLSRSTIVNAYEMLMVDGFVVTKQGSGSFVADVVPRLQKPLHIVAEKPVLPCNRLCAVDTPILDQKTIMVFRRLLNQKAARADIRHFTYTDPRGCFELREALASYLAQARGLRLDPSQIFITSGTQQSFDFVMRALLPKRATVLLEDPTYRNFVDALRFFNHRVHFLPHEAYPSYGKLPKADAFFVTPSKRFPLCGTLDMQARLALLQWARENQCYIIEDDYDGEIRFEAMPLNAIQGLDDSGHVIYMGTFSKTLFAGLQCAYMVVPAGLVECVMTLRAKVDRRAVTFVEEALADLIAGGYYASHLRRATKRLRKNRDRLIDGLKDGKGSAFFTLTPPHQGLHLVAFLDNRIDDRTFENIVKKAGYPVRALSRYCETNRLNGLLMGFCGFAPENYYDAGKKIADLAADFCCNAT